MRTPPVIRAPGEREMEPAETNMEAGDVCATASATASSISEGEAGVEGTCVVNEGGGDGDGACNVTEGDGDGTIIPADVVARRWPNLNRVEKKGEGLRKCTVMGPVPGRDDAVMVQVGGRKREVGNRE